MAYQILDVELEAPLPDATLSDGCEGVAVVVRRRRRPIGFVMYERAGPTTILASELADILARECGRKLVQEAIAAELVEPARGPTPRLISIAICTKDRPELVQRCLDSLTVMRLAAADVALEILVIDNAPSDRRTEEVVAHHPDVRYLMEPRPGLNFARNRALRESTGEILAYLDDDVVVDREWIAGLLEAAAENPDAAAFTGLVLPYELETPAQILFERRGGFRRGFEKIRFRPGYHPGNPWYPSGAGTFGAGCNMAFRRDVLVAIGGFDEALDTGAPLPGGGDLDIFYRVVRAGHPLVYEPRLLVFHEHRRELPKLRRQYWTWGMGFMAFLDKSYRTDPGNRVRLRGLLRWWFADELRQLADGVRGRHTLPVAMIAAEFAGGIVGLTGTYSRSVRRMHRIRARQP